MNPNERPRFSAVLSRIGQQIEGLSPDQRAKVRADFIAEAAAAKAANRPIKPGAFLGDGQTAAEATEAFVLEYDPQARDKSGQLGLGRGAAWATAHGAQAFINFIPALAGASDAN